MENREKFQMIVDDSGYNYTEIGTDGKTHEVVPPTNVIPANNPGHEVGHHKYFVGILIPNEKVPMVCEDIEELSYRFRYKLARSGTIINEIHANEMFNNENSANRRAFVEYLQEVTEIIKKYNLTVFVSPKDSTIRTRTEKHDGILKNYSATLYPYYPNNPSKKAQRKKNLGYQKQSLRELIDMANIYLSDGGYVSTILCDEGLHKPGTQIQVSDDTSLMFLSSEDNSLIQFADAVAWLRNRVKEVTPDRVGRKKCEMLEDDITLAQAYNDVSANVIEHDESKIEKNFENMINYLTSQSRLIPRIVSNKKVKTYVEEMLKVPHVRVGEVKHPLTVCEQDDELVK